MISINHFSQSHLFDTSDWRSIWDLTLTLKQARKTDDGLRWIRTDEYQCREAFRHFMNLLNRAVYGNAYRRNFKKLRVLPILEKASEDDRNTATSRTLAFPCCHRTTNPHRSRSFQDANSECWSKVDWGYREICVRPNANHRWINYMLKERQKSAFETWSDCIVGKRYTTRRIADASVLFENSRLQTSKAAAARTVLIPILSTSNKDQRRSNAAITFRTAYRSVGTLSTYK